MSLRRDFNAFVYAISRRDFKAAALWSAASPRREVGANGPVHEQAPAAPAAAAAAAVRLPPLLLLLLLLALLAQGSVDEAEAQQVGEARANLERRRRQPGTVTVITAVAAVTAVADSFPPCSARPREADAAAAA